METYLKPSVVNAGLDPDNLPHADKNDMNFGSSGLSGDNSKKLGKIFGDRVKELDL